ncbi:MAG: YqaJ viral recombinase family protein [Niabella sp.]
MQQGTQEWHQARLGRVTASRISDVMARGQGGKPSAVRANYMAELIAERLTGEPTATFTSKAMEHGTETEDQARAVYTMTTGNAVKEVGFLPHPRIAMSGASPDGLIGDRRGLEIKCPNTATHIATLRGGAIKREYLLQMQWGMACTGREAWEFVSFDPRLPDALQLHVRPIEIDATQIFEIEAEVETFLAELDETLADLRDRYMKEGILCPAA